MTPSMIVRPLCAMVCLAGLAATCLAAEGLVLVKDGKSDYVINVSESTTASELWAAEELQSHIEKISGARIPISNAKMSLTGRDEIIFIGRDRAVINYDWDSLGTDGYIIRTVNDAAVVVAGGKKRGTLYGVYTLLEKLGVRWWTPSETHIPKMKTVKLPAMDIREVPKLEYRDMMYMEGWDAAGKLWHVRNRLNGFAWSDPPAKYGGRYKFVGNLVHSYNQLLKQSGMKITDEMWALRGGNRRPNQQPCLTYPDVLKAMTRSVIALYRKNPDARFVVVGQNDNKSYCECENCAAVDEKEGSHSGQVIHFANKIAQAVEKEIPGANICTPAYEWSRKPPAHVKPRKNVFITLCSIECDFAHPQATATNEVNAEFRKDIVGWGKIAQRVYIWDYVTNYRHHLMPFPNFDAIVPNVKFFADNGARGVFEQGAHTARGSEFVELRMWVLAKALWNPEADGKALIKEFCDGYYGPASPAVQKYLDVIHTPARKQDFVMPIYRLLDGPYIAPEVMAEAEAALREAEQAAKGDAMFERRVRHAHMPVWYVLAKRGPGSATWKAVEAKVGKLDMQAIATGFARTAEEYRINAIADGEALKPWLDWLQAHARLTAEKGVPVPPELEGKDPGTYRLIQGCQFDGRGRWYTPAEGASDGWAVKQPTVAWTVTCALDDPDHFQMGKKYRLKIRAKAVLKPDAKGRAWNAGVWRSKDRKTPASARVDADTMRDGQWKTIDLGEFEPAEGDIFYFATQSAVTKEVLLDCLWLEEVPAK